MSGSGVRVSSQGSESDACAWTGTCAPRTDSMSGTASPTPSDDPYTKGANRLAEYAERQWQGIVEDPMIGEIGTAPTPTTNGAAARPPPVRPATPLTSQHAALFPSGKGRPTRSVGFRAHPRAKKIIHSMRRGATQQRGWRVHSSRRPGT